MLPLLPVVLGLRAPVVRSGSHVAVARASQLTFQCSAGQFATDLSSDDWRPLRTESCWSNPCFVSSLLTTGSVWGAARRDAFVPLGVGPLFVLASSILYWHNPVKESPRRAIDLITVRTGLALQVILAHRYCAAGALPRLLGGYAAGILCYALGRVLTVRGKLWTGAFVHCGVHVFANLGNWMILPYYAPAGSP